MGGAYASFEEDLKGSITAGKLADFVILAQDPHDVDPSTIKAIRIARMGRRRPDHVTSSTRRRPRAP